MFTDDLSEEFLTDECMARDDDEHGLHHGTPVCGGPGYAVSVLDGRGGWRVQYEVYGCLACPLCVEPNDDGY